MRPSVLKRAGQLLSRLRQVEMYLWMAALGCEILYVTSVLGGELISLLLWRPVSRFERRLHAVPEEKYFAVFMTPMLAFVGGLLGGVSTGMIGENPRSTFTGVLFTALIVFLVARYQYREATGRRPRPVAYARWRGQAAEIAQVLSEGHVPTGRERLTLQKQAETLGVLGSRITDSVSAQTWHAALRAESRRRKWTVVASVVLPVILGVWPAMSHGVARSPILGYGLLLAVSLAAVAAPALRRVRMRLTLLALGNELAERSRTLLDQLARATPPRPRPLRVRCAAVPQQTERRRAAHRERSSAASP